jgi:hypothetical protein
MFANIFAVLGKLGKHCENEDDFQVPVCVEFMGRSGFRINFISEMTH